MKYLNKPEALGVDLIVLDQAIDITTPPGRLLVDRRTVTWRRSPSSAERDVRILSARCLGV